jgi:DNA polymerase-4
MAERLKAAIRSRTDLAVTVGVAASRAVARMASASAKPDGLKIVEPGAEMDFLRDRPVGELPGVGPATAKVLERLNVATIGSLSRLPVWSLEALFGAGGTALYERSHGRDSRLISRREIPQSISRETSFRVDTSGGEEVASTLHYLAERAMKTLRGMGLSTRRVRVKIRYSDFTGDAASKSLPRYTNLDSEVFEVAREMLRRLWRRRVSLHGVGIVLSGFMFSANEQPGLFDGESRKRLAGLYHAIDEVRDRYGYGAIMAGKSLELLKSLPRNDNGFILRTPSLTK